MFSNYIDDNLTASILKQTDRIGPGLARYFEDPEAEQSFRRNYNKYVIAKVRLCFLRLIGLNLVILLLEIFYQHIDVSLPTLIGFRLSLLLCGLIGFLFSLQTNFFQSNFDVIIPVLYVTIGFLLLIMYILVPIISISEDSAADKVKLFSHYIFFRGNWSLCNSLIYIYVLFALSGLRFYPAFIIAYAHVLFFNTFAFLCFIKIYTPMEILHSNITLVPAMFLMCMVSNHDIEWQVRDGYLMKCKTGEDLRRQDELILSILPADITAALKSNRIENLAKYYDNVTILFCYIVDFGYHSSSSYAQDLVALLIQIITKFDRIVDLTGVYKVENIAETYMCVGGCPNQCEDHAVRIAKMSLAMIEAVQAYNWTWPDGTPVSLQIGIHTGPVVAGVVGSKSYSYHLFGDSVNTSSRMCSHSLPGRVQLSREAYIALKAQGKEDFNLEERGEINVKGKGLMRTYWLLDFQNNKTSLVDLFLSDMTSKRDFARGMDRFSQDNQIAKAKVGVHYYDLHFVKLPSLSLDSQESPLLPNNAGIGKDAGTTGITSGGGEKGEGGSNNQPFSENTNSNEKDAENSDSDRVNRRNRTSRSGQPYSYQSIPTPNKKLKSPNISSTISGGIVQATSSTLSAGSNNSNRSGSGGIMSLFTNNSLRAQEEKQSNLSPGRNARFNRDMGKSVRSIMIESFKKRGLSGDDIINEESEQDTLKSHSHTDLISPDKNDRNQSIGLRKTPIQSTVEPIEIYSSENNSKRDASQHDEAIEERASQNEDFKRHTKQLEKETTDAAILNRLVTLNEHVKQQEQYQAKKNHTKSTSSGANNNVSSNIITQEVLDTSRMYDDAHVKEIEQRFLHEYNETNTDQFRRMLLMIIAAVLASLHIDLFNYSNFVRNISAFSFFTVLLISSFSAKFREYLQLSGLLTSCGLAVLYVAIVSRNFHRFTSVDSLRNGSAPIVIIGIVLTNLCLRLRFPYALITSSSLVIAYLIVFAIVAGINSDFIISLVYVLFVQMTSLNQIYKRESGLRQDFAHQVLLEEEREKSQRILMNMLPSNSHALQLIKGELILDELSDVTLLYSDMKGFTQLSSTMHPRDLCTLLNIMYSSFDKHLDHFGLYKIDTIGDAFVVVGGLPGFKSVANHALACVQFALHMQYDMAQIRQLCEVDVQLRIGIHTGTVMGSVVSLNKPRYLVWGPSSLTANAMESQGVPGGVMISSETQCRLNEEELRKYDITLTERENSQKIAMHTKQAYMVECTDMKKFQHQTWSTVVTDTTIGDSNSSDLPNIIPNNNSNRGVGIAPASKSKLTKIAGRMSEQKSERMQAANSKSYDAYEGNYEVKSTHISADVRESTFLLPKGSGGVSSTIESAGPSRMGSSDDSGPLHPTYETMLSNKHRKGGRLSLVDESMELNWATQSASKSHGSMELPTKGRVSFASSEYFSSTPVAKKVEPEEKLTIVTTTPNPSRRICGTSMTSDRFDLAQSPDASIENDSEDSSTRRLMMGEIEALSQFDRPSIQATNSSIDVLSANNQISNINKSFSKTYTYK